MKEYHKILTVLKRNPETNYKTLTDEWACPEFEYLKNLRWVFTEKIDGTNIRIMWDGETVQFGGKTDRAQIPEFLLARLREMFSVDQMREVFPDGPACLYGEGYGAKIQKGGGNYIKDGVDFILFDVRVGPWWLRRVDAEDIANKLGISCVPVVGVGNLSELIRIVRRGFKSMFGQFKAEGIVARPEVELFDRLGKRIITKLKHKDFERS
jgi:hypothetical protein